MTRTIAFANQKGGVGKTTTAVNLGAYLARFDSRVVLVDLDPQANATSALGVTPGAGPSVYEVLLDAVPLEEALVATSVEGLYLVPSSGSLAGAEVELVPAMARETRLRRALAGVPGTYDEILIDCPPSLGLLTVNALAAAEGIIVPVQCEYLALEGLRQLLAVIEMVRSNLNHRLRVLGFVLTMFDGRTNLSHQVAEEVRRHFPQTFRTMIPRSVRLSEAPSYGQPILRYAPSSAGGQAYERLAEELRERR